VAITAINPLVAYVVTMPELHGLLARKVSLGVIRRPSELSHQPERDAYKEYGAENANPGYDIRASMKDLAHFLFDPGGSSKTEQLARGRF
jgi:hypothetical protein